MNRHGTWCISFSVCFFLSLSSQCAFSSFSFLSFCSFRSFVLFFSFFRSLHIGSVVLSAIFIFQCELFFSLSSFFFLMCERVFFSKGVDCYRRRLHIFFFLVFPGLQISLSLLSLDVVSSLFSFSDAISSLSISHHPLFPARSFSLVFL